MDKSVFQSQLEDREAMEGLLNTEMPPMPESVFEGRAGASMGMEQAVERLRKGTTDLDDPMPTEAIVMLYGYPSLLVQKGTYSQPENKVWRRRLDPHRTRIDHVIGNTGRVDLVGHRDHKWVGTAWRINETSFITNRHVAAVFSEARANGNRISPGVSVRVDLAEEHEASEQLEHLISAITHIEPRTADSIDIAILRLDPEVADLMGDPIELELGRAEPEFIGVTGYPAFDRRNPDDPMARIFGGIYDVKRFAPGRIMDADYSKTIFTHNATTLGGNSGSVVCDIETGRAVGLHFAGSANKRNYAAKAEAIADVLRKTSVSFNGITVPQDDDEDDDDEMKADDRFADRDGYDPAFLGTGALLLPLPQLNAIQKSRLARTTAGADILKYRHFSVAMNGKRRLAYFCAANIDGENLRRPRRKRSFKLDPRLSKDEQAGEALYSKNDFDRGHLIRRLDPTWGTKAEADQANVDSMFFPNIAPQHKRLNQRIWLGLEEHILDLTDERDARISVFVGCVFDDHDPEHDKTGIRVPMAFWKVVASVGRERRGRTNRKVLQTQAFILSQDHLVEPGDFEIVFGSGFETHQITVEELERITGLDFHAMRAADTFGLPPETREERLSEAVHAESPFVDTHDAIRPLSSLYDIVAGNGAGSGPGDGSRR